MRYNQVPIIKNYVSLNFKKKSIITGVMTDNLYNTFLVTSKVKFNPHIYVCMVYLTMLPVAQGTWHQMEGDQ